MAGGGGLDGGGGRTLATYCHFHLGSGARLAPAIVAAARRGQRVVSLLPSATEMVAAVLGEAGAAARLVGVSEHCDWPAAVVAGKRVVTRSAVATRAGRSGAEVDAAVRAAREAGVGAAHTVDVAWLAAARPALVLTQDTCAACDAAEGSVHAALRAAGLGPERALTLRPVTVAGVLGSVRRLGAALGEEAAAEATAVRLEARLAAVERAVLASAGEEAARPRLLGLESLFPLVASGQWLPDQRARAGARDALGDEPGGAARLVSWAEVEGCGAEAVVLCCCGRTAAGAAAEAEQHLLSQTLPRHFLDTS